MRPKLYMSEICPSARAVVLTAKVLQLTLEVKEVPTDQKVRQRDLYTFVGRFISDTQWRLSRSFLHNNE